MIHLSGADLVLPDRVLTGGTITIEGDRIVDIEGARFPDLQFTFRDHYIVPGFIDVHVHGIAGTDSLDGGEAIRIIAERLPRYGVTAFCPTSIACDPAALRTMLNGVRAARTTRPPGGARVLPAHLESNFISAEYRGAQPLDCLRSPRAESDTGQTGAGQRSRSFTGADILTEIAAARPDVGIVTVAPELDGALELIHELVVHGHHVSLGHSGATYEQAIEAVRAGARQATHLFNRMTPVAHRTPGLAGAVLECDDVIAELVCDGIHVHPAMMRVAL
ncbi:MAG TPA: amidohydrolase family protein, partial [Vicinamibacterales bacterium]